MLGPGGSARHTGRKEMSGLRMPESVPASEPDPRGPLHRPGDLFPRCSVLSTTSQTALPQTRAQTVLLWGLTGTPLPRSRP